MKKDIFKEYLKLDFINNDYSFLKDLIASNFDKKAKRISVFDMETTNSKDTQLYSFGVLTEKGKYIDGLTMDMFLSDGLNLARPFTKEKREKPLTTILYGANNAKFDNYFILSHLKNSIIWKETFSIALDTYDNDCLSDEWLLNRLTEKTYDFISERLKGEETDLFYFLAKDNIKEFKELDPKEKYFAFMEAYNTSIHYRGYLKSSFPRNNFEYTYIPTDKGGRLYEIVIMIGNNIYSIRDLILLFPNSVKGMGDYLNKKFKTKLLSKRGKEDDYLRNTLYKNYEEFKNDGNEREYLFFDCFIVMIYFMEMNYSFNRSKWKLTAGSTAFANWKYDFLGKKLIDINSDIIETIKLSKGVVRYRIKGYKNYVSPKKIINNLYSSLFPLTEEHLIDYYNWYSGAITFCNENMSGLFLDNLAKLDIKSSYPSVMNSDRLYPIGVGITREEYLKLDTKKRKDYKLSLLKLIPKRDLKNELGLPFIGSSRTRQKILYKDNVYHLTNIEYEYFLKYVKADKKDYKVEYNYYFKAISGKFLFKEYVDYWYSKKQQGKDENIPSLTVSSKLFLNSLYGKLSTKRIRESKYLVDGEWKTFSVYSPNQYPIHTGLFITSYARLKLVDILGENYKVSIGGDTDSIIIPNKFLPDIKDFISDTELGKWEVEVEDMKGIFRRKKQYAYIVNGKNIKSSIAYAGINFSDKKNTFFNWEEFIFGKLILNQKTPHMVPSGKWIENTSKWINPIISKNTTLTDIKLDMWYMRDMELPLKWDKHTENVKTKEFTYQYSITLNTNFKQKYKGQTLKQQQLINNWEWLQNKEIDLWNNI